MSTKDTGYFLNTVHTLPLGRVIVNPPLDNISWMYQENVENNFKNCAIVAESWGGNLWIPDPRKSNSVILSPRNKEHLGDFKIVRSGYGTSVLAGIEADGVLIPKGDNFGICSADCPTVVFEDIELDLLLACHAGRNSLLGGEKREKSVIKSALRVLSAYGSRVKNINVYVFCGISAKNFTHSLTSKKYAKATESLVEFLEDRYSKKTFKLYKDRTVGIDLYEIIVAQCKIFGGIKRDQVWRDKVDTGVKFPRKGQKSQLASHRRNTGSRNFIMVHHARDEVESSITIDG
jgi:copper oxidase (laccase) domain-containing protein